MLANKSIKRIVVSFLFLAIVFGLLLSAMAASSKSGKLDGRSVTGSVRINNISATATINLSVDVSEGGETKVNLSYSYIDTRTNYIETDYGSKIDSNYAEAHLSKPKQSYYRSWRAEGRHSASYSGQSWDAETVI